MTEILAFVLGVSAVAFVWVAVVVFKIAKLAKQNEESIRNIEEWLSRNDELVNRRIDQEIDRVNRIANDCIKHTDSRVDKLESKVVANYGAKEILKG